MLATTNLQERAGLISSYWNPEHVLTVNGSHSLKIARIKGEFIWHSHPETDEVFQCLSGGPFSIQLCTTGRTPEEAEQMGADKEVHLKVGDLFCVPKGMQHRPIAHEDTGILMIEKVGTVNTGDREGHERTVHVQELL